MTRSATYGEQLSIITPVSRPELLPLVSLTIPPQAEWILVTDGPMRIPPVQRPHVLIEGPRTGENGDVQRGVGLEAATRPFVYFLDDDNLMLPALADLVIPFLRSHDLPGALFGLAAHVSGPTPHLWPAPHQVRIGCVDTAMFLGRRDAILQLRFEQPVAAIGWPNLQGQRHSDFIFLKTYEDLFGLARLPAIYGFHNGMTLLQALEPRFLENARLHPQSPTAVAALLNHYLIGAGVPPWWW